MSPLSSPTFLIYRLTYLVGFSQSMYLNKVIFIKKKVPSDSSQLRLRYISLMSSLLSGPKVQNSPLLCIN